MSNYVGVDWASDKHDVRVCEDGREAAGGDIRARRAGTASAVPRAGAVEGGAGGDRATGRAAGRAPAGRGAAGTGAASQPGRGRAGRFRAAGGKSDRFDAFVLCELARTDNHRFRVLEPDSDETKALRALTRAREDLVHANRAGQPAARGAGAVLARPDRPVQRSRQPDLAGVPGALSEPSRRARSGRAAPAGVPGAPALLRRPEARPAAHKAQARARGPRRRAGARRPPSARARAGHDDQAARRADQAARPPDRHRDARAPRRPDLPLAVQGQRRSPPPSCWRRSATAARATRPATRSPATPARPPSRSSPANARQPASAGAATSGCAAPSARLADSTRHWHPWAQDRYAAARARGHDHPRALRTVGRAWCRIVWRCWQDRTPYDPARHRALQQHCAVTDPHSRRGPAPTSPPPSGCSAPPSPTGRPAGPSAKRLTASRHPLSRSGG